MQRKSADWLIRVVVVWVSLVRKLRLVASVVRTVKELLIQSTLKLTKRIEGIMDFSMYLSTKTMKLVYGPPVCSNTKYWCLKNGTDARSWFEMDGTEHTTY
jgi:hypothetical protein